MFQTPYLGWLRRGSETIPRPQKQPQQMSQSWPPADTNDANHPAIQPQRCVNRRHAMGQVILKIREGNSLSYHFVDALLPLGVANSAPLADAPCTVLSPPDTDHDASSSTTVLTIGLVCEGWTTSCFPGVTDDNTQFHSMCERVCVCVHISTLHESRIVTSFRSQDTQRVFVWDFSQPHRMSSDISLSSVSLWSSLGRTFVWSVLLK